LRSSARFTPRTFVGNNGWITDHSKSVKSNRAMITSYSLGSESKISAMGKHFYGYVT